jgi:hypothetical protein
VKLGVCLSAGYFKKRVTICKENNAEIVDEKRGKYQRGTEYSVQERERMVQGEEEKKQGRGKKRNLGRVI